MNRFLPRLRLASLLGVILAPCTLGSTCNAITPQLSGATLDTGGGILYPVRVDAVASEEHLAGSLRFEITGDTISSFDRVTGDRKWTSTAADNHRLVWLDTDGKAALLEGYTARSSGENVPDSPLRVRRIDLTTGSWLPDWRIPIKTAKKGFVPEIAAALGSKVADIILVQTVESGESFLRVDAASYTVDALQPASGKLLWSKSFTPLGPLPSTGAIPLWRTRITSDRARNVNSLSWIDVRHVCVCAGPSEDILALDTADGSVTWRFSKIWEYQRGFVGPSSYFYFISRFATRCAQTEELEKADKSFTGRYRCEIIGGPVVVSTEDGPEILVATETVPYEGGRGGYQGYSMDCNVYDIRPDEHVTAGYAAYFPAGFPIAARIISMATLPRIVIGGQSFVFGSNILWSCWNHAAVCIALRPSSPGGGVYGPPGGPDLVTRIGWYKELAPVSQKAWVNIDPAADVAAFGSDMCYKIVSGGYILHKGSHEYDLPIELIDDSSGDSRSIMLRIPFDGEFASPSSDFGSDADGYHIGYGYGYGILLNTLDTDGTKLRIGLASDKWSGAVVFDLASIKQPASQTTTAELTISPSRP